MSNDDRLMLRVARKEKLTDDVIGLTLVSQDGQPLPHWTPGSHIELALSLYRNGAAPASSDDVLLRQYSLCSDYRDQTQWQVAVLREDSGRGGSRFIHKGLREGDTLQVSQPRNLFPFAPRKKVLFIAGGIGITPMLPMIQQADAEGIDWRLVYLARDRSRMSLLDRLTAYDSNRIRLNGDAEDGPLDLTALLTECDADTSVYSCGPKGLLDALEGMAATQDQWSLHIERFSGGDVDTRGNAFDVVINSTGQRLHIPEGRSVLSVLRENGFKIPSSCGDGVCGSCETGVLAGTPDHRDAVLSPEEKADNDYMMLCVSRALSDELVLDL
ncbi:PDR/VanB family oxidoreductase [Pontibacterium granulatum]|uniref:PDR/VanB family oxidoreductase n=1 Tax=Pontibacterium granulatum TaxID=2036029 RepID=UPI00249B7D42|nr:PDR/VanB family oxidoreductase [Pontibacterium granulatum]MDI3325200.1 PDR/VanB family oxidoreductase [Pontibacterium granulatum]